MNTVNIVLMVVLSAIIGFEIGNIYGKESVKKTISNMMKEIIKIGSNLPQNKKEE